MVEAVYIHIPFCEQKCRYCDFLSFGHQHRERMAEYISCLRQEIILQQAMSSLKPRTIFIGGGTPSCLPTDLLVQVLQAAAVLVTPDLVEYTIESNPGTLTVEKLKIMSDYGLNRLSLGIQSDQESQLQLLGRSHTFEQAVVSYQAARAAGFENINFDLMYGLPGQNLSQWRQTLAHILALQPEHLSLYQLKIEPNTVFDCWLQAKKLTEFDDELAFEMYQLAHQQLEQNGFRQYEISNYAQPGKTSQHNQVYWRTANYWGFGLGAHSFLSPTRHINPSRWSDYVKPLSKGRLPMQTEELLDKQQVMEETIFMGLRMNQGVSLADFAGRYQVEVEDVFAESIAKCRKRNWLVIEDGYLKLTDDGRVLGNLVFVEFV